MKTVLFSGSVLFATGLLCHASTIILGSNPAETANNTSNPTIAITTPDLAWSRPLPDTSWVSYTQSGNPRLPGFVLVPNGTAVTFTDTFTLDHGGDSGQLIVMADDTASVSLNGILLMGFPTGRNKFKSCSDLPIGCTFATAGLIDLTSALHVGENVLSFTVVQNNSQAFGLDYSATIQTGGVVPEPRFLALAAIPLLLASMWRRKTRSVLSVGSFDTNAHH